MSYWLGIDTGGTFTDFVAVDKSGHLCMAKTPSTPEKPSAAIRAGLEQLSGQLNTNVREFLADASMVVHHGSTAALNALIQHKGAKTSLLTTAGFRDFLEMREGYKERRYDFSYPPPTILVPRYLRLPVQERVDRHGEILTPLCEEDVEKAIEVFRQENVEAVAVCFLWSFLNPIHERRVGEILRAALPEAYISLSVDVLPQIRPYERTSTTVLNAYLGPNVRRYISDIDSLFRELGYSGELRYVQSNGGVASREIVTRKPVAALNSGPASGPIAGLFFGRMQGWENIITVDMGGTSFDICLVESGQPTMVKNVDVHRYRVGVPMIDIHTLGAGGGSIAWIDPGGILRVGPQSAEAVPGPACYMSGGSQPTVTDADVVLGYLNPDHLLGGQMLIHRTAAEKAISEHVAKPLGLSLTEAALGIYQVVNHNMIAGIRTVSIERGHDPRDFVLVAAGGGGAVHIGRIAQELEIRNVLIPKVASVFCAFGQLIADVRHDYGRSYLAKWKEADYDLLKNQFVEMEDEGRKVLATEGLSDDDIYTTWTLDLRYRGQIYEVSVELPQDQKGSRIEPEQVERLFHKKHEALYTYRDNYSEIEVVNLGVATSGRVPEIRLDVDTRNGKHATDAIAGERSVYFNEYREYVSVSVFNGDQVQHGNIIDGPAIVEEVTTAIVVLPDWRLKFDGRGYYIMSFEGGDK